MNIHQNLGELNRRLAESLTPSFATNVVPYESGDDGSLLFRGPIANNSDPKHIGTHVAVSIERDVRATLEATSGVECEELVERLVDSLGTQVKVRYHPEQVGQFALEVIGTMATIGR